MNDQDRGRLAAYAERLRGIREGFVRRLDAESLPQGDFHRTPYSQGAATGIAAWLGFVAADLDRILAGDEPRNA